MDTETTESKILQATIEEINVRGLPNVTVRGIADRAGVNIAAINYYYRSKDRLIETALEQTMHNAFDEWMEIIRDRERPIRARFRDILREMIWGVDTWPGVTRAHLYGPVVEGEADTLATGWFQRFFELVSVETETALPSVSAIVIRASLVELFTTAMFAPLVQPMFAGVQPYSLKDDDGRFAFVNHLLDTFFRTLGDKRTGE